MDTSYVSIYKTKFNAERQIVLVCDKREISVAPASDPKTVVRILNEAFDLQNQTEEYMYCLCLNTANKLIGIFEVSHGSVNQTIIDRRAILQKALKLDAVSIILVHNHPSGSIDPSAQDITATEELLEGAELVGLQLVDHIIVGVDEFYSIRKHGLVKFVR